MKNYSFDNAKKVCHEHFEGHGQQERKERAQKRTKTNVRSVTSSCWTWKTFLYLEGTIKCLTKGE